MPNELFQTGEEFYQKRTYLPADAQTSQVQFTLYNNSNDSLDDTSLIGQVTEPNMNREAADMDTVQITPSLNGNGNFQVVFEDQIFDVSNATMTVDSFVTIVNFQSSVAGDSSASDNLLFAGFLDQDYPLDKIDSFTLRNSGIAID